MKKTSITALALAAFTGSAAAQTVTVDLSGPATASAGDTVTVTATATVTGLAAGGAIGGYGLDLDVTEGAAGVAQLAPAVSPVFSVGVSSGTASAASLDRIVAGQVPNIDGINPGVDTATTIVLFTVDVDIDGSAPAGDITFTPTLPALNGGIVLFPDAASGANLVAPTDGGTSLVLNPLTVTIGDVTIPCTGDTTGDGFVGPDDLFELLSNFGQSVAGGPADGDIDPEGAPDGTVGPSDLFLLLANFGTTCS